MDPDRPWQSYHTVFTNAKAGMDGVDKEKVQKVVYEMSKGSKYFENEQRKEATVMQKIQHMQEQAALLTESEMTNYEKAADSKISALEAQRDLTRIWMHVDLDAFYAAVETLDDPSIAGKPIAVGGMSMICTANYEARKFGVRAAMPGFIACKLCPELTFIRPDFEKYTRYSEKVRQVFSDYDPHFLPRSLDEAYLDITKQCSLRNMSSGEIAEELRRRVYEVTGLTCSAGIGPNRLLAKVCSDINKPNGQFIVPNGRDAVMTFISTLPIRKISGIGKVTERLLKDVLSVNLCKDLIEKKGLILALFSSISADFFFSVALGIGGSETPLEEPRKSLSCERTFTAISSEESLFAKLEELAENVAKDMESECLQGRTITLKLKTVKFEVRTRSVTLSSFIYKKEDIFFQSSKLLKAELPVSLRLMGLRVSHFQGESSDMNQRTLSDFFSMNGKEVSKTSIAGDARPCEDEDDFLQISTSTPCPPPDPSTSGTVEISNSTSATGLKSQCTPSLGPSLVSTTSQNDGSCVFNECTQLHSTTHGDHRHKNSLPRAEQFCDDSFYRPITNISDFDCKPLSEMKWIDDNYCSLCKLEIPSFLCRERQEHMDFHLAQILQHRGDLEENSRNSIEESKRHSSPLGKETPPKRVRAGKAEVKRHTPIDAFFPRV